MKIFTGTAIRPLDNQINSDPNLVMKPPFSCYISAQKGAGKSTLLLNLLLSKDLLANKFNQIYYISPTASLDPKTQILKNTESICVVNTKLLTLLKKEKKNTRLFDNYNSEPEYSTMIPAENFIDTPTVSLLESLLNEQRTIIQRYKKENADHILLIYDDCISAKKFFNSETVQKMLFNSRHYKISIIITSQSYRNLPKCLRLNMSQLILFTTSNHKELQIIYEENSSSLGFKQFEKVFREICDRPFNALIINYQNPIQYRLQDAFQNFILNENSKNVI